MGFLAQTLPADIVSYIYGRLQTTLSHVSGCLTSSTGPPNMGQMSGVLQHMSHIWAAEQFSNVTDL